MKRLYTVTVSYEYAALAESEAEAERYAGDALREGGVVQRVRARPASVRTDPASVVPPEGWDGNSLVYGADEDVTFDEASVLELAARRTRRTGAA